MQLIVTEQDHARLRGATQARGLEPVDPAASPVESAEAGGQAGDTPDA